jgi:lysophospholipase L1-like esterase
MIETSLPTLLALRNSRTRVGYIGDSILVGNNFATSILISTRSREITWARALYPHFECDVWMDSSDARGFVGMNAALGGYTVAMNRSSLPSPSQYSPQIMIVSAGINSATTDASEASIETDLEYICKFYLKHGIKVILSNIRPVSSAFILDGSPQQTIRNNVNRWIQNFATTTPNVVFWDVAAAYDDGTGRPRDGFTHDGLHPTPLGSQYGGTSLVPVLKTMIKPIARRMADDSYNDYPNGRLTGSAGATGNGVTGMVATNFTAQMVSGGSTTTVVASLAPNRDTGGSIQRFKLTTNGGSTPYEVFGYYGANFIPPAVQWVKARARVMLSAWSGWRSPYFWAGGMDCFSWNGTTDQMASDTDVDLDIESMPFLTPASPVAIRPHFWIYLDPRVPGTNVVAEMREFEFIQVDDPIYLHNA